MYGILGSYILYNPTATCGIIFSECGFKGKSLYICDRVNFCNLIIGSFFPLIKMEL